MSMEGKRGQAGKRRGEPSSTCCLWGLFSKQRPLSLFLPIPLLGAKAAGLGSLEPSAVRSRYIYIYIYIQHQGEGVIPLGMTPPREVNSIYTSQRGIQGKEGECGGWTSRDKPLKSDTPPQPTCSPSKSRSDKPQCQVGIQRGKSRRRDLRSGQVELFKIKSRRISQS